MKSRRNIRKPFAAILFAAIMVLSAVAVMCTTASAATEEDIENSINMGVAWLVCEQNPDGSWGSDYTVARTGFALVKLEDRSRELGREPLDSEGPYYQNIQAGIDYLMTQKINEDISGDLADKNGNGNAVYFTDEWGFHHTYSTGIALMAIANSGMVTDDVQDMVDWFIKYQNPDGGWIYNPQPWGSDNSNTGYAALGLAYAKVYGADIEDVLPGLNSWADYIQNDVDGDTNDGGSGYTNPDDWVNILKTGNLIFEFGLVGDTADSTRVQDAVDYIVRHWNDPNSDPGWRPHHYQSMYCAMKGLESLQIDEIDGIDWFDEFSTVIVNSQNLDGSWPNDYWGDEMLSTVWALLTLEKVVPNDPPDVSEANPSLDCLWPVNHKFVDITIEGVTDPDGDDVTITITGITSDEPTASIDGAGNDAPDAIGVGTDTASLRAERSGTGETGKGNMEFGNGRVYEITFVASDGNSGETTGSVFVKVPHDQKGDCVSIDDGQIYDATGIN